MGTAQSEINLGVVDFWSDQRQAPGAFGNANFMAKGFIFFRSCARLCNNLFTAIAQNQCLL